MGSSAGHRRFRDLVLAANLRMEDMVTRWNDWAASRYSPKVIRNAARFLDPQVAAGIGKTTRQPIHQFCIEELGLAVEVDEFDRRLPESNHVDEFRKATRLDRALLEDALGEYGLYRPRVDKQTGAMTANSDQPLINRLHLYRPQRQGPIRFRLQTGDRLNGPEWCGDALCAGRHIYLVGYGKTSMCSLIVSPKAGDPAILTGLQLIGLSQQHDGVRRHRAVARPVVAWRDPTNVALQEQAEEWLRNCPIVASGTLGISLLLDQDAPESEDFND